MISIKTEKIFLTSLLVAVLMVLGSTASAKQLRYATGFPPGSISAAGAGQYAEWVKEDTNDEIGVRVFALSLLNAAETSDGVRDGIADIGYTLVAYFPRQFPHVNMINESSMLLTTFDQDKTSDGKDAFAFGGAIAEYTLFHCPACIAEYERQNQVFTSGGASSRYGLLCTKPIETLQDLRGARMRVAGSHWSRWATELGSTTLTLTINEIREGLGQGIMDCNVQSAPEMINLGLLDVVTYINMDLPGGVYGGTGSANVNKAVWSSLTEEQRSGLLKSGSRLSANLTWRYYEEEMQALETASEHGITIGHAAQDLRSASIQFVEEDLVRLSDYYSQNFGIENGEEILEEFSEVLERWIGLVQDIENEEDLEALYWSEIFSKIDVNTYGVN